MSKRLWIATVVAALSLEAGAAAAQPLPGKIGYTVLNQGQRVGHCDITVTTRGNDLVMDSTTDIDFGSGKLHVTCHTVADKTTYLVRSVEWKGVKGDVAYSGNITIDGDSLYGTTVNGETKKTDYLISPNAVNLVLEDYIMDHEVLIARAHLVDGHKVGVFGIMLPSSFALSGCTVTSASKAEIENDETAIVCDKILIAISGSDPFASFYDPTRGVPVYLAFPQTNVEVFLDEFFGDAPVSRYRETPKTEE
jgi:hypothetical protein